MSTILHVFFCFLMFIITSFNLGLQSGCSKRDISISQSRHPTSGIPEFIVQIVNTCVTGCPPSNIHVRCGWFASTRILNPITFKRLSYDDCLVNGGRPLKSSQSIRLTYANSFMYPFQFKSASFC
ncbi:TPD1 protein homolog 1-like isoform X2 [Salvia hispanica]|uniref:TPD1 protein homolog 1-like isoform X2 n=1 Tax=Salvia hispanica TaxID=49212 RepID=UPI002009BE98|nr:TPD1 protein homolog 1-like isoform X2 [Salvia hispanica]